MAQRVQAVERALSLLEAIAASATPKSVPELAELAGVNRATAWRLINTLAYFDLVERDGLAGRYTVGFGAMRLAAATNSSSLVRRAKPVLKRTVAKTGGTAFLEVTTRGQLIVLDECRSESPIQVDLGGVNVPLHCGSVGKLYLATLRDDELDAYLQQDLEPLTPFTCTNAEALREQIRQARQTGVAYNYKEHHEEWCGITAAVRDRAGRDLAYVNVTLPTFLTTEDDLRSLTDTMTQAAKEIADLLLNTPTEQTP